MITLAKTDGWEAAVGCVTIEEMNNEITSSVLHDKLIAEAAVVALNSANNYPKLIGLGGGVKVLKFTEAVSTIVSGTRLMAPTEGVNPEVAMVWIAKAEWAHPASMCLEIQNAVLPCTASFMIQWDAPSSSWRSRLEDQQCVAQQNQVRRMLSTSKQLIDRTRERLDCVSELGLVQFESPKLVQVSMPVVALGFSPGTSCAAGTRLSWVRIDEAIWEWNTSGCDELGSYTVCMSLERVQTWTGDSWDDIRWEATLRNIVGPGVSLTGNSCQFIQGCAELMQVVGQLLQPTNKLGTLKMDQLTITVATPVQYRAHKLGWDLQLHWASTQESDPICTAAFRACHKDGSWDVQLLGQRVVVNKLSQQTRQRMGCDGGTVAKVRLHQAV